MSDYSTRCPHVFQGDRCIDRLGHSGKHTNKFGPEGFFWDDFHSHEILYVAERAYTQPELNAAIAEAYDRGINAAVKVCATHIRVNTFYDKDDEPYVGSALREEQADSLLRVVNPISVRSVTHE